MFVLVQAEIGRETLVEGFGLFPAVSRIAAILPNDLDLTNMNGL